MSPCPSQNERRSPIQIQDTVVFYFILCLTRPQSCTPSFNTCSSMFCHQCTWWKWWGCKMASVLGDPEGESLGCAVPLSSCASECAWMSVWQPSERDLYWQVTMAPFFAERFFTLTQHTLSQAHRKLSTAAHNKALKVALCCDSLLSEIILGQQAMCFTLSSLMKNKRNTPLGKWII